MKYFMPFIGRFSGFKIEKKFDALVNLIQSYLGIYFWIILLLKMFQMNESQQNTHTHTHVTPSVMTN